ncbi:hypothetical protein U9M48_039895, partial [Paspalum notatum var. saurae]
MSRAVFLLESDSIPRVSSDPPPPSFNHAIALALAPASDFAIGAEGSRSHPLSPFLELLQPPPAPTCCRPSPSLPCHIQALDELPRHAPMLPGQIPSQTAHRNAWSIALRRGAAAAKQRAAVSASRR